MQLHYSISTKFKSNNAVANFYAGDEISILKHEIPEKNSFKLDEKSVNPISIGEISEDEKIKEKLRNKKDKFKEWESLVIELSEKFIFDDDLFKDYVDPLTRLPDEGLIVNSIFLDQLPFELQKKSINRLKEGQASNPHLEDFIFDIGEARRPIREEDISIDTLIQKNLNPDQFKALKIALNAPDIALIQGPPGTGKTTVIAELCHQVVLRGGKALISSQTNLAVDNALNRIANLKEIRPIRIGRNVTDEGYDFIETNVVKRWFSGIKEEVEKKVEKRDKLLNLEKNVENLIDNLSKYFSNKVKEDKKISDLQNDISKVMENKKKVENELEALNNSISENKRKISSINSLINKNEIISEIDLEGVYASYPKLKENMINRIRNIFKFNKEIKLNEDKFLNNYNLITISSLLVSINKSYEKNHELFTDLKALVKNVENINSNAIDIKLNEQSEIMKKMREATTSDIITDLASKLAVINKEINDLRSNLIKPEILNLWTEKIANSGQLFNLIKRFHEELNLNISENINSLSISLSPNSQHFDTLSYLVDFYKSVSMFDFKLSTDEIALLNNEVKQLSKQIEDLLANSSKKNIDIEKLDAKIKELIELKSIKESNIDKNKASLLKGMNSFKDDLSNVLESLILSDNFELNDNLLNELRTIQNKIKIIYETEIKSSNKWSLLQKEWVNRIDKSIASDYESLKDTYLDFANVIGATCSEAGKWSFYGEKNREFDLVIIDEVSKATPPELLMPMLLGKQIVLVGDHRQLPPTFKISKDEIPYLEVEDNEIEETHREFKDLVTTSYFQDLFEDADKILRHSLNIQYRMHTAIMQAINQFYPNKPLQLGLKPPESDRFHPLKILSSNGEVLSRNDFHIAWIDSSFQKVNGDMVRNFEEHERGRSKSRFNKYEVKLIETLVKSFDQQLDQYKMDNPDFSIPQFAFISFYMGQVRKIKDMMSQLIKKNHLKQINGKNFRIGSVDRFQGMERYIVIVSLVSAPSEGHVTRFVKEFRRLNVAFSRAQSLLIVVGSKEVFNNVPVDIRLDDGTINKVHAYQNIIKLIDSGFNGGGGVVFGHNLISTSREVNI